MPDQSVITKITQDLDKVPLTELSPGIVNNLPTKEFIEQVERIESKQKQQKAVLPPPVASVPAQVTPSIEVPQPIVLEYRYAGNCSIHNVAVETFIISLDEDKSWWAVAYCMVCKKKLVEQKVKPLQKEVQNGNDVASPRISKPETVRKVSQKKKIPVFNKS